MAASPDSAYELAIISVMASPGDDDK